MAADSILKKSHPGASVMAAEAFQKLKDVNDPKFKDWDEASNYIVNLSIYLFKDGLKSY